MRIQPKLVWGGSVGRRARLIGRLTGAMNSGETAGHVILERNRGTGAIKGALTSLERHYYSRATKRAFRVSLSPLEQHRLLVGLDLLAINGALLIWFFLQSRWAMRSGHLGDVLVWFLPLSALWLVLAHAFDAYELRISVQRSASAQTAVKVGVLALLIYFPIAAATQASLFSRMSVASLPILMLCAVASGRALYASMLSHAATRRPTLILGTGWTARAMADILLERVHPYYVVGCLEETGEGLAASAADAGGASIRSTLRLPILGSQQALPELVRRHDITTIVVSTSRELDSVLLQALITCVEQGVDVIPMPALYEQLTGRVPVEHIGKTWHVELPVYHPGTSILWQLTKRAMDIFLATFGLVCCAVILPFVAIAIWLDSPGPIFYAQERVGRGGRIFRATKFRSMVRDAEEGRPTWAQVRDIRVTRVGRILRATHLDEFPQFFNVLRGEMSAVGPRPERPEFVEHLAAEIPFYRLRHSVKPGMAGWALVRQGYSGTEQEAWVKLQYDLYYIKHQSLWLDLLIVLQTIRHAMACRGR